MIRKHTLTITNETPFILTESGWITGREIRGLFGYVAMDLNLDISEYFISFSDNRIIFKNPKPINLNSPPDIRIISLRGRNGRHESVKAVYSRETFEVVIYSNDGVAEQLDKIIGFLKNSNTFLIGKGRYHGYGKFKIVDFVREDVELSEIEVKTVKILSTEPFFIEDGKQIDDAFFINFFKGFNVWARRYSAIPKAKVKDKTVSYIKDGTIFMYKEGEGKAKYVNGRLMSIIEPLVIEFDENIKIPKEMSKIWGIGDYIQYGYGGFEFV